MYEYRIEIEVLNNGDKKFYPQKRSKNYILWVIAIEKWWEIMPNSPYCVDNEKEALIILKNEKEKDDINHEIEMGLETKEINYLHPFEN